MSVAHIGGIPGSGQPGLLFLFRKGLRPTRRAALAAIERGNLAFVSHDPADAPAPERQRCDSWRPLEGSLGNWMELLRDGLAYDLLGLADGPSVAVPVDCHPVGHTADFSHDAVEAIGLFAGPHIAEGAASLPVIRTHLALAADMADQLPGLVTVCWAPMGMSISPSFFVRLVRSWLAGGIFPASALMRFEEHQSGTLRSQGLAFFTGQEVELTVKLCGDSATSTALAARVIHELIAIDRITAPRDQQLRDGEFVRLKPSADGGLVYIELSHSAASANASSWADLPEPVAEEQFA